MMNKKAFIEAMKEAQKRRYVEKGLFMVTHDNAHNIEKAIEADINRTEAIEEITHAFADSIAQTR